MNHRDAWATLDEYLDGSLTAARRWAVTAHLEECAACRKYLAEQARFRGAVREQIMAVEPPPGFTERLRSAIADEVVAPRRLPAAWDSPGLLRLAAVVGPALAALWLLIQVSIPAGIPASNLTGELTATHALFAHDETLLDVTGDAKTVAAWFHTKAGLTVAPPELAGYEFVGGRLITLDGQPVAQLVYESQPGEAYLSLLRFRDGALPPESASAQQGTIATVLWPAGGEQAALVGALPASELHRLAGSLGAWTSGGDSIPS